MGVFGRIFLPLIFGLLSSFLAQSYSDKNEIQGIKRIFVLVVFLLIGSALFLPIIFTFGYT